MTPFLLLLLPALALTLFALLSLASSRHRLRRRRPFSALLPAVAGMVLLLSAILFGTLAAALFHYQRLDGESEVASLSLRQLDTQRFAARLDTADGRHRSFELLGDQWQLDARVLRWKLPALLSGAPNVYRLERLSGRYQDIQQEREAARTVHDLAADAFPDLWVLKRQFPQRLGFVEAEFGSGAYLPMFDGARYRISLGPRGGLIARPADAATQQALQQHSR